MKLGRRYNEANKNIFFAKKEYRRGVCIPPTNHI
jgi:hypothetical protein